MIPLALSATLERCNTKQYNSPATNPTFVKLEMFYIW